MTEKISSEDFIKAFGSGVKETEHHIITENKGDLISREALKEHKFLTPDNPNATRFYDETTKAYQKGWNDCVDAIIDNAPTISPKQGEWIEKVETKQLGHGWLTTHEIVCSVCGGSGENDENIPQCWKFCPNCGARMKKGGAE